MKQIVGFSGGIDSQKTLQHVRSLFSAEDIIALNSPAGDNEHPLTVAFVEQYSREVFPITVVPSLVRDMWLTPDFAETKGLDGNAPLDFETMIQMKHRAPSRKAQFCTIVLKLRPQRRWVLENVSDEYERWTGLRRDESEARKDTPEREWDEYFDCFVNRPLVDFPKQRCFDEVLAAGEPINPLYALGFGRVGCAPCINSGKDDVRRWADRFPAMIDKIRGCEQRTGVTFFSPMVPGIRPRLDGRGKWSVHNYIDEVVAWSRTDRGGLQFNILKNWESENRPSCESKYGLCE
jgi:3'-phosphoadenosine 5'-phosphosulfate sulfotransferase (PAPS reductase)/FAD synthetase